MIKANELRIGNWVLGDEIHLYNQNIHGNGYTKLTGLGIHYIEHSSGIAERYNPIPLTREVIEKTNLEDCSCGGCKVGSPQYIFHMDKDKLGYYYHETRIESLHQLQNLYFALTGQELEYKP